MLFRGGARDTNDPVELRFGLRFIKQRDDDNGQLAIMSSPDFDLSEPKCVDFRMENALEFFPGDGIGENDAGEFSAAQPAVGGDDRLAEMILDFRQCEFAGLDELVREVVGIHHLGAVDAEESGGGGFAHAHAAGQSPDFHRRWRITAR